MFRSIFRPYGLLWNFLNTITDVLLLSLLFCACCLPVVTIGASAAALYDAAVRGIRYRQGGCCRRFLSTFRREWKSALPVTLLWGIVLLFGTYVLAQLNVMGREDSTLALISGVYRVLMLFPLSALCWSVILISRTAGTFRSHTGTALRLIPAHILSSILIPAFTWLVFWYCLRYPIGLTFAPAVAVLCWSLPAERILQKYGAGVPRDEEDEQETE